MNLTVLVMDNGNYLGSHKSAPGMRTATAGKMKLQEVAKGCGIASSHLVQDVAAFRERVQTALKTNGPHFICARVEALDGQRPPKTKPRARPAREQVSIRKVYRENRRGTDSRPKDTE